MSRKGLLIPVNPLAEEFRTGIALKRINADSNRLLKEADHPHRHDYHIFILAEKGAAVIEIDFEEFRIAEGEVIFIHPNQVHRIQKPEQAEFYLMGISYENLDQEYLQMLEDLIPAKPLSLNRDMLAAALQSMTLCITLFEKKRERLYSSLLKYSCNTFVALIVSQYLSGMPAPDKLSRFDIIAREFRRLLEQDFILYKRPSDYARAMHISTPYLNECVREVSGFPVSYHIQQRIVLEAKRLLCHSDLPVKGVAAKLGYEDYAYFSRLFHKATGTTAQAFRNKNLG